MPGYKRKRTGATARVYKRPTKKARKARFAGRAGIARVVSKMIGRTIETKESQECAGNAALTPQNVPHNNVLLVQNQGRGAPLNPFVLGNGTGDPMGQNNGSRIGDQILLKGFSVKILLENPVDRCNTHYRIMLMRGAKGETFDVSTIFKGDNRCKLLDTINTERFSIVFQKIVNVRSSNGTGSNIGFTGVPGAESNAGLGTRYLKFWIPGTKFGRGGNIQYENASASQVKFYDYRFVILGYDWFGTPANVNTVGKLNDMLVKMYFKDA